MSAKGKRSVWHDILIVLYRQSSANSAGIMAIVALEKFSGRVRCCEKRVGELRIPTSFADKRSLDNEEGERTMKVRDFVLPLLLVMLLVPAISEGRSKMERGAFKKETM